MGRALQADTAEQSRGLTVKDGKLCSARAWLQLLTFVTNTSSSQCLLFSTHSSVFGLTKAVFHRDSKTVYT